MKSKKTKYVKINISKTNYNQLIKLMQAHQELHELETWSITDLDDFREISDSIIDILTPLLKVDNA